MIIWSFGPHWTSFWFQQSSAAAKQLAVPPFAPTVYLLLSKVSTIQSGTFSETLSLISSSLSNIMIEHGKVKQSCDLLMPTSSASQLSEAVTAVTAFINPVNLETIKSGGNECYVCGTRSPDFVRTVSQRDIMKCVYGNPQTFYPSASALNSTVCRYALAVMHILTMPPILD